MHHLLWDDDEHPTPFALFLHGYENPETIRRRLQRRATLCRQAEEREQASNCPATLDGTHPDGAGAPSGKSAFRPFIPRQLAQDTPLFLFGDSQPPNTAHHISIESVPPEDADDEWWLYPPYVDANGNPTMTSEFLQLRDNPDWGR